MDASTASEKCESVVVGDPVVGDIEGAFAGVDGYKVSKAVRDDLRGKGKFEETEGLTYGEVRVKEFGLFLGTAVGLCAKQTGKLKFADVGSGTGKAVVAAACALVDAPFEKCVGVEIVKELHECAESAVAKLEESDKVDGVGKIKLYCCDGFDKTDLWIDADVIFVTTTCFTDEMINNLQSLLASKASEGTIVITTTRAFSCKSMKLLRKERVKYARGALEFMIWKIKENTEPVPSTKRQKTKP
uniref:Histone-lysine N-methyltransferase, H3 lysine-79 specific n=1 Tax=Mucochytrium quahogii TaxID=96639 RepID=A0A7S2WE10_9STRA|mmetsp:Transcript_21483/g.34948  ORF Transcript_21483/g.34948 Transcript_21483/m.34948 type:complete len:244 (-) Transcript_21483:649-1380(-)